MSGGVSLTSWKGVSLALVGYPYSDAVIIKIPYGVDILLHRPALHSSFPNGLVKTESDFTVRSVETDLDER